MIEKIISKLSHVRKTGPGRYIACCPAHDDRSPSLAVTKDGDTVLLHCFTGCETESVLAAIGLTFQDIWPKNDKIINKRSFFNASDVLAALEYETTFVMMAANEIKEKKIISGKDFERLILARNRIKSALEMTNVRR